MPGVRRIPGRVPRGVLTGGAPRAVWTTSESDPASVSAASAAYRTAERGQGAHLVWNPGHGEIVQLIPATSAAVGRLTPHGSVDRGTEGRACIVILVVGFTLRPFTEGPLNGLASIVAWLDSWGVSRRWPAGPPGVGGLETGIPQSSERLWAQGGHFGHSQVPDADTAAPGAISLDIVLGRAIPPQSGASPPTAAPVAARRHPSSQGGAASNGTARLSPHRESVHV